jgi:hypothetical protein
MLQKNDDLIVMSLCYLSIHIFVFHDTIHINFNVPNYPNIKCVINCSTQKIILTLLLPPPNCHRQLFPIVFLSLSPVGIPISRVLFRTLIRARTDYVTYFRDKALNLDFFTFFWPTPHNLWPLLLKAKLIQKRPIESFFTPLINYMDNLSTENGNAHNRPPPDPTPKKKDNKPLPEGMP